MRILTVPTITVPTITESAHRILFLFVLIFAFVFIFVIFYLFYFLMFIYFILFIVKSLAGAKLRPVNQTLHHRSPRPEAWRYVLYGVDYMDLVPPKYLP